MNFYIWLIIMTFAQIIASLLNPNMIGIIMMIVIVCHLLFLILDKSSTDKESKE